MAISKRGNFENPKKSPYNFEKYDSDLERQMMLRLEKDSDVERWMKRHGISIPWIDKQHRKCSYLPDFLVQYNDGTKAIIEVKNPALVDSDAVQRKRAAAEHWCKQRGMQYKIATIY